MGTKRLHYSGNFSEQAADFTLLSLPEPLLATLVEQDGGVSIKGRPGDEAVLCTGDQTYALRLAEATNTLLLVPPTGAVEEGSPAKVQKRQPIEQQTSAVTTIVGSLTDSYILQHIPGRLQRARELLGRCVYRGPEAEDEVDRGLLLTWEDLVREVQASAAELRQGLSSMGAVEIGGYWRIVDGGYFSEITQLILGLCVENDWPSSAVPADDCVSQLPQYCPYVIRHCIAFYRAEADDSASAAGTTALDPAKVCAFVAQTLLQGEGQDGGEVKQWPQAEFMERWNDGTPADMTPTLEMLRGVACVATRSENKEQESYVYSFPESALPPNVSERFAALFEHRTHWTLEELEPYIKGFCGGSTTTGTLLAKHTRSFLDDAGERIYRRR